MIDNVSFIADHFRAMKKEDKVRNFFYTYVSAGTLYEHGALQDSDFQFQISSDWSYVANVIDRLVLIIFTFVNVIGTVLIIQNSPMLFDHTEPMKIVSFWIDSLLAIFELSCFH